MKNIYKNSKLIIALTIIFAFNFTACKKKDDPKTEEPKWTNGTESTALEYLKTQAEAPATKTIDAATGGDISQNGIAITIPADMFAKSDGTPYSGSVSLKLYTVNSSSEALYKNISTISDSGDMLISGGMFKLEATDGSNNPLRVASGKSYMADLVGGNLNDKVFRGAFKSGTGTQLSWDVWPNKGAKRGPNNNTIIAGLDSFQWCNLDRYMSEKPLTDIFVKVPAGFTSANTEVFMKYAGEKANAYIPANSTLKQFTTSGAYYKVVQGRGAKLLALCKKDGKFYYATVTISSITANHTETITTMTETTEANFKTVINNF